MLLMGKYELVAQYVAVARDARQGFAQHPFGRSAAINVAVIDQGNSAIERTTTHAMAVSFAVVSATFSQEPNAISDTTKSCCCPMGDISFENVRGLRKW